MRLNLALAQVIGLRGAWLVLLAVLFSACSGGERLVSSESPLEPVSPPPGDTIPTPPPPDPQDSVVPPSPDPQDSVVPPPDPQDSVAPPPTHIGIAFGPAQQLPADFSSEFSGTVYTAQSTILADLQAARRNNMRVFVSFTGNEQWNRDQNGFSMTLWKNRVDRFRSVDLKSFIEDGTIIGHFILDEPSDPNNWNGHVVPLPQIDEMAKYSKEIWPDMPTIIRAWPHFLKGYDYRYLDAVRFQYHARFGAVNDFIATNMREAKELGLALVGGLNVLAGGGADGGIPGYNDGRYAMSAAQLRSWGALFLAESDFCAIILWEYHPAYFSRADIKAAFSELSEQARRKPKKSCRN